MCRCVGEAGGTEPCARRVGGEAHGCTAAAAHREHPDVWLAHDQGHAHSSLSQVLMCVYVCVHVCVGGRVARVFLLPGFVCLRLQVSVINRLLGVYFVCNSNGVLTCASV